MSLDPTKPSQHVVHPLFLVAKIAGLAVVVYFTNPEVWLSVARLLVVKQWVTLAPLVLVWVIAILALAIVAASEKLRVRALWGLVIAASTAVGWGYYQVTQTRISILDMMGLWASRHEAGRATQTFATPLYFGAALFLVCFALFLLPGSVRWGDRKKWASILALVPVLPLAMIAAIVWQKRGTVLVPMPSQFSSASIAPLFAFKAATQIIPERRNVAWQVGPKPGPKNIVMLVDESLRADYLDFTPNNPFTPQLADLSNQFVNFGPAASGGNCSNYANAILRFGVSRENVIESANTNATLFAYAKHAGFRTVYIDAQGFFVTGSHLVQNFMTLKERADIDGFYALHETEPAAADEELAKIVEKELKSSEPVFIYANKNGQHFPYDLSYPATAAKFHPTQHEARDDNIDAHIASYRNAIRWSVDHFFATFFQSADLSNATLIYTSDHGQRLQPGKATHCQVENPDPRMGLVPLLVYTSDANLRVAFEKGAATLKGKSSHFQIAPTLYHLMGYADADIATQYDETLLTGSAREPWFSTGDIFGVFDDTVNIHPLDLARPYLEPEAIAPNEAMANTTISNKG